MWLEWQQPAQLGVPPALMDAVGGHPIVTQLLTQRGFTDPQQALAFLDPTAYKPAAPDALLGVTEAAKILYHALQTEQNILVWGDFDVDGQTSTSLLVSGLRTLSALGDQIRFHVPNRFSESHGIRPDFLIRWLDDPEWTPRLLLSCDTGIAETEAVVLAKERGLTVVLTDHHDLTAEFEGLTPGIDPLWGLTPDDVSGPSVRLADVIVNPKFQPADDPLRTLPGVGVAFKLMQQLYIEAGITGREEELLDLVALGIVADVAEQVHDARYLLQLGLERLRTTQRTGLLALMDVSRVVPKNVTTDSIGFQIGPRMNALGRLEDATVSVELLTTTDPIRAGELAAKMERLNQERRQLTTQMTATAFEMIERNPSFLNFNALVLAHPAWHAGIVGIVASRLVEEYSRPVVLMLNPPGERARGSARSFPGIDIGASIAGCTHLLLTHGGHPGAAGLSLLPENIDAFRRELDRQIVLHRTDDGPPTLPVDAELKLDEIDIELVEEVQRLAPFGNGNPTPNFMSTALQIVDDGRIGREGIHRKFTVAQHHEGKRFPVLWFNDGGGPLPQAPIDLVYTLNINEYRGKRSVQLMYVDSRPSGQGVPTLETQEKRPQIHIVDLRQNDAHNESHPHGVSPFSNGLVDASIPARLGNDAIWYAEGTQLPEKISYAPRGKATGPTEKLVLWSIPPSPDVLLELIETTSPWIIYIHGENGADDSINGILRSVGGMSKYAINSHKGIFTLLGAASRLGTTTNVIRLCLRWLEQMGVITIDDWANDDTIHMRNGVGPRETKRSTQIRMEIERELDEIRAYRRYFQRASLEELGLGAQQIGN